MVEQISQPLPQTLLANADLFLMMAGLMRTPHRACVPSRKEAAELASAVSPENGAASQSLQRLCAAFAGTPPGDWSDEYHRLFEGPLACPVNETAYIRRDKGAILADLCGFYLAFGFHGAPGSGEKADHLQCELEFLAMLLVMLSQAIVQSRQDAQEVTAAAVRQFCAEHLNDWIIQFCSHLTQSTRLQAYQLMGHELSRSWRHFARMFDLPKANEALHAPPASSDLESDGPMQCDMGSVQAMPASPLTIEGRLRGA